MFNRQLIKKEDGSFEWEIISDRDPNKHIGHFSAPEVRRGEKTSDLAACQKFPWIRFQALCNACMSSSNERHVGSISGIPTIEEHFMDSKEIFMSSPSLELEPKNTDEVAVDLTPVVSADDEELQDLRDFKERWNEAKANVSQKHARVEQLKDQLKTAKKAHDVAVAELLELDEEEMPLFDQQKKTKAKAVSSEPVAEEAWRGVSITELDILFGSKRRCSSIVRRWPRSAALSDFTKDGWNQLEDIQGIGEAKATQISDAVTDFYAKHPEYCQKQSEAAELNPGPTPDDCGFDDEDEGEVDDE